MDAVTRARCSRKVVQLVMARKEDHFYFPVDGHDHVNLALKTSK